jgi:hypothetical protein
MAAAALFVTSALADPHPKTTDKLIEKDELSAFLAGTEIAFYDAGRATYWADGTYAYRYGPDKRAHIGRYEIVGNSEVCVTYPHGASRCDLIVKSGARYVLITKRNERFPIKDYSSFDTDPLWVTAQPHGAL